MSRVGVTLRGGAVSGPGPWRFLSVPLSPPAVILVSVVSTVSILVLAAPVLAAEDVEQGREVPVTATDLRAEHSHNSPMLAVDPTDSRFVVLANRLDAPDFGCQLHVSGNGGETFIPADPVPDLPEGAEKCYAPEVAFGPDGTLYYLFAGLAGAGNRPMGIFLTTSQDYGRSFSPPFRVLGPGQYQVRLRSDTTVGDDGRLHLVWLTTTKEPSLGSLPPPPNPIVASHSDDRGATWSEPVQVSGPAREHVVAPALALGENGSVHVAYYDLRGDRRDYHGLEGPPWDRPWSLVMATSRDGGETFGPSTTVDEDILPGERVMLIFTMAPPALAADGHRLVLAWADARHGDRDVLARRSLDGGATWEGPVRISDDRAGNGRDQYLPQLAVSPDGRIDALFYDRREDPDNRYNHVYLTWSQDGGRSFAPNVRITSAASDSEIGQRYQGLAAQGLVEIGSRIALWSGQTRATAAWTDTRESHAGGRKQDIRALTATFPEAGGALPRLGGAGVALGLLIAAVAGLSVHNRRRRKRRGPTRVQEERNRPHADLSLRST